MIAFRSALFGVTLGIGLASAALAAGGEKASGHDEPDAAPLPPIEPLPVDNDPKAPYRLVRTLEAVQDQAGFGNSAAHAAQRPLIRRLAEELAQAPAEVWKEPRNGRALVSYVLSGGDPAVLQKLLDDKVEIGGVDPKLLGAALAYANRRNEEALVLFGPIKARELPDSLGARVALVQGILLADRKPDAALHYFGIARLLAPGSLVEQGGLRRQAVLASKLGRWAESEKLATIYLRRFGNAVYASTFYREFVELLAGQPDVLDEDRYKRLAGLLNQIEPKLRRQTYLLLAEKAVIAGRLRMAQFASQNANALYDAGTSGAVRSTVYGAAADVATERTPEGVATLQSVDRSKLAPRDTMLMGAALELGSDIRREPGEPVELLASQVGEPVSNVGSKDTSLTAPTAVMDLARKSIGKVDELLKADNK